MLRKSYLPILLILLPALVLAAPTKNVKRYIQNDRLITGDEVVDAPVAYPPYNVRSTSSIDDIVGDTLVIGTTWYESQHNGTIGRMVAKDDQGYLHFIWMKGLDQTSSDRHVFYNYIDPESGLGLPEGVQVETSDRAGYTTMDIAYGDATGAIAFPAFHQMYTSSPSMNFHTATATDFFPHTGAFLVFEGPWIMEGEMDLEVIWPRIQFGNSGLMHIIATENPASMEPGSPQRQYYISANYDPSTWTITYNEPWTLMDWTMTIAADLATSDVSDKVAIAWTYCKDEGFPDNPDSSGFSQWNNDIWVLIDDDGQDLDFSQAFNLTNFIPPDLTWLPDSTKANMDTLRAFTDISVFIDQDDWVHIAFTTRSYFEVGLEGYGSGPFSWFNSSIIWHWSEQWPDSFRMVAKSWDPQNDIAYCGAWNVKTQRPSLGQDPATGYLYCSYQQYDTDTTALSATPNPYQGLGYPSGEVFVSVSTDGGMNWSEGINITNTISPDSALAGECLSELCPTMAKLVDDTCHIMYVMDRDAGFVFQEEGGYTLNDVIYHSVPVELIPTEPTIEQDVPFHVEHGSAVEPGSGQYVTPKVFALEQNYPNPFNPTTTISFSLDVVSNVSLKVYNLKGEAVAELAAGTYNPGQHTVAFDAADLSSGVYIYKLQAGTRSLQRKMLLLK